MSIFEPQVSSVYNSFLRSSERKSLRWLAPRAVPIQPESTVSVVIPTYNRASLLERSVRSVLHQTYSELEVIVVDDGSDDDTERVIRNLDDPRVTYKTHDRNRGAAAARNTGLEAAAGDLIAFQDSDDVWRPHKLERQVAALEEAADEVGFVFSGLWRHKGDEKLFFPALETVRERLARRRPQLRDFLEEPIMATQTCVAKAECLEAVGGFDERLPRSQDWELSIRLARSYGARFLNEPLVESYLQPDSLSKDHAAYIQAREMILDKHRKLFDRHPKIAARHYYRMGNYALNHDLDEVDVEGCYRRALREDRFQWRYWAAWILSLGGRSVLSNARRLTGTGSP